jgi:hypothetical protein
MELPRKEFGVKTLRYPPSGMRKKEIRFAWDEERLGAVPRCPTGSLHPIPMALKRGLAEALSGFSEYSLAKYRGKAKALKVV